MDSLDWSKKYEVLSISRLVLRDCGLTTEQITALSDDDMQTIASQLNLSANIGFYENVRFVTRLFLAEKRSD